MTISFDSVREKLADKQVCVLPGVYDVLSAKLAERAGFEAAFISGYSVSASLLGQPDVGLLTQTEIVASARRICGSVDIPIIVDADTGYGNPLNVIRTVEELVDAGAKGCFLEDQVWPKRCGHMSGKRVIPLDEYLAKIRAAIETRGDDEFFLVARTDARGAIDLDEAIRRGLAAKEAGADAIFIEAPRSTDEMKEVSDAIGPPLVANMIEKGVTPLLSPNELSELGFHFVVSPLAGLYAAAQAMKDIYAILRSEGTTRDHIDRLLAFDEFNEVIGLPRIQQIEQRFASPTS
jgi:methylisocitrate lyase